MLTLPADLAKNVLNEVYNGFRVPQEEESTLEAYRQDARRIHSGAGSEEDSERVIGFSGHDEEIMCWALRLTLKDLGVEEFQTRTGYDFDQTQALLNELH